jgi:enamine deaminase RidA (YjgF/YER057c/UK114 family)
MRNNWNSESQWESAFGYSSAVQIGNFLEVSGTSAFDGSRIVGLDDITLQTEYIIKKIEFTLSEAGFDLSHVIRTRIYVTDISLWKEIAAVYSYLFNNCRPASTIVEVSKLIHPEMLIEIEATALKETE